MQKGIIIIYEGKKQSNISLQKCHYHHHTRTVLFTDGNGSNADYIITLKKYTTFLNHPFYTMIHEGCATSLCLLLGWLPQRLLQADKTVCVSIFWLFLDNVWKRNSKVFKISYNLPECNSPGARIPKFMR